MSAENPLAGRSVLVTGGAGAFGRAFVAHALAAGARRVVVFSRDEAKHATMRASVTDPRVRYLLGDVRDPRRIADACRGVEVVVHAAAMKRVEACEDDPFESVQTNIIGTMNVAWACVEQRVQQAVFLSTDKAAAPATLYGSCKLTAERTWNRWNVYGAGTGTRFAATRYGNVTNSTGSVIPLWRAQAPSGSVTVTDPRMTRFLMPMAAAVDLVVLALREMQGGEVFLPKIAGARMVDLAAVVAPGCAQTPVGIRPGEKLHEVLIDADEARRTFDCGTHYVIQPPSCTWGPPPILRGVPVPEGFTYVSNAEPLMGPDDLARVAA